MKTGSLPGRRPSFADSKSRLVLSEISSLSNYTASDSYLPELVCVMVWQTVTFSLSATIPWEAFHCSLVVQLPLTQVFSNSCKISFWVGVCLWGIQLCGDKMWWNIQAVLKFAHICHFKDRSQHADYEPQSRNSLRFLQCSAMESRTRVGPISIQLTQSQKSHTNKNKSIRTHIHA